jgi:hypothetical protein
MRWKVNLLAFAIVVVGGALGAVPARGEVTGVVYCCKSTSTQCCGTEGCAISAYGCRIFGSPAPGPANEE